MMDDDDVESFLLWATIQASAFEKREKSRAEKIYGEVMLKSATALAKFTRTASFDQLMRAEKAFQQNDLIVYAKHPSTMESAREGIDDFKEGESAYWQLIESTDAYREHPYRKKERANPEKIIPLDAMRRALRGQIKRLENYRKNVMGNPQEREFLSERIAMLHRAEKLYDAIQRERLLPPASDV